MAQPRLLRALHRDLLGHGDRPALIAWIHASRGFGALFAVLAAAAGGIFAAVMLLPRTGAIAGRPSAA